MIGGTPTDPSDDVIFPLKPNRGDTNNPGVLDVKERWEFDGSLNLGPGLHTLHPVFNGDPVDAQGNPAGSQLRREKTVEYFVSNPQLGLFVGIYEQHNGGLGCKGSAEYYAPPAADITYCYVVTNNGNVDLSSITIKDPALGIDQSKLTIRAGQTASLALLHPLESVTLYFETKNTGDLRTQVIATGRSQSNPNVFGEAESQLGPRQLPAT
jgi:hypothetical protein